MITMENKEIVHKYINIERVPVSGQCDVCGKTLESIEKKKLPPNLQNENLYDYYRITTHHHDWGNDSADSYEY